MTRARETGPAPAKRRGGGVEVEAGGIAIPGSSSSRGCRSEAKASTLIPPRPQGPTRTRLPLSVIIVTGVRLLAIRWRQRQRRQVLLLRPLSTLKPAGSGAAAVAAAARLADEERGKGIATARTIASVEARRSTATGVAVVCRRTRASGENRRLVVCPTTATVVTAAAAGEKLRAVVLAMRGSPSFRPPLSGTIPLPRVQEPGARLMVEVEVMVGAVTGTVKRATEVRSDLACKTVGEARGAPGARRGTTREAVVCEEEEEGVGGGHTTAGRTIAGRTGIVATAADPRTTTATTTAAVSIPKQGTCIRWVRQATLPTRDSRRRHTPEVTPEVMVLPLRTWCRRIHATCTVSHPGGRRRRRAPTPITPTPTPLRLRGMKKDMPLAGVTRGSPRGSPNGTTGARRQRQAMAAVAVVVVVFVTTFTGARQAQVREVGASHPARATSLTAVVAVAAGAGARAGAGAGVGAGIARDDAPQQFIGVYLARLPAWVG